MFRQNNMKVWINVITAVLLCILSLAVLDFPFVSRNLLKATDKSLYQAERDIFQIESTLEKCIKSSDPSFRVLIRYFEFKENASQRVVKICREFGNSWSAVRLTSDIALYAQDQKDEILANASYLNVSQSISEDVERVSAIIHIGLSIFVAVVGVFVSLLIEKFSSKKKKKQTDI